MQNLILTKKHEFVTKFVAVPIFWNSFNCFPPLKSTDANLSSRKQRETRYFGD